LDVPSDRNNKITNRLNNKVIRSDCHIDQIEPYFHPITLVHIQTIEYQSRCAPNVDQGKELSVSATTPNFNTTTKTRNNRKQYKQHRTKPIYQILKKPYFHPITLVHIQTSEYQSRCAPNVDQGKELSVSATTPNPTKQQTRNNKQGTTNTQHQRQINEQNTKHQKQNKRKNAQNL
jgi:hypothetical protein